MNYSKYQKRSGYAYDCGLVEHNELYDAWEKWFTVTRNEQKKVMRRNYERVAYWETWEVQVYDSCTIKTRDGSNLTIQRVRIPSRSSIIVTQYKEGETTHAYKVKLNGKEIDMVFYAVKQSKEEIKRSLVDHDSYDPNITIHRVNRKSEQYQHSNAI